MKERNYVVFPCPLNLVAKDGKGKATENKKPSKTSVAKQKDSRDRWVSREKIFVDMQIWNSW